MALHANDVKTVICPFVQVHNDKGINELRHLMSLALMKPKKLGS